MNPADNERHGGDVGYWRPTWQQELLLRAALRGEKEAIDAWHEWHASVDINRLDAGSHSLLPLVYRNLRSQAETVPDLGRLKGNYRYTWYKNKVLLHVMAARLRAFHDAGVKTLVLKGAALITLYYKDSGSRPMEDFDVLVRPEQARAAMGVLRDAGWQPVSKEQNPLPERLTPEQLIPIRHAWPFEDAEQRECDLHWYALEECSRAVGDDDFWDAAVPVTIDAVTTHTLSPADQLLHVCAHGAWWNPASPVRWLPDAVTIVNVATASADGMDWQRLTAQAFKHRLRLPLQDMLRYLRDGWDVAVPSGVLDILQETPVTRVERFEYTIRISPPSLRRVALGYWIHHIRLSGDIGIRHQLVRFPEYLRQLWGLEYLWQVPFRATYSVAKRMLLPGYRQNPAQRRGKRATKTNLGERLRLLLAKLFRFEIDGA